MTKQEKINDELIKLNQIKEIQLLINQEEIKIMNKLVKLGFDFNQYKK